MRQNKEYVLKYVNDVPYILPFGQKIADLKRGLRINETGVWLWNELEREMSKDMLMQRFLDYINVSEDLAESTAIKKDIAGFLEQLISCGVIDEKVQENHRDFWKYIKIGGIIVRLEGYHRAFSKEFEAFEIEKESVIKEDMVICVHCCQPCEYKNGRIVLRNDELMVVEREDDYLLLFPQLGAIIEAAVNMDGTRADFYCNMPCDDGFRYDLFHGIRLAFLYRAQMMGKYALHSASILYKEKVWLFSGPSGTGKSTHTNLWQNCENVPIINGDLNLIELVEECAVVHGMPWCGTSQISNTGMYPLGGIILLKQHDDNMVIELQKHEKSLKVMQRLISPSWTKTQMLQNVEFAEQLIENIYVGELYCTKEPESVRVIKDKIDLL